MSAHYWWSSYRVVAKPAVGTFDFLSNVSGGLRNATTAFDPSRGGRCRLPRHIPYDGILLVSRVLQNIPVWLAVNRSWTACKIFSLIAFGRHKGRIGWDQPTMGNYIFANTWPTSSSQMTKIQPVSWRPIASWCFRATSWPSLGRYSCQTWRRSDLSQVVSGWFWKMIIQRHW
jgi:hypothetical protein